MQALPTIEITSDLQVRQTTDHTLTAPVAEARGAVAARSGKRPGGPAAVADSRFRLGDAVRHGRFGSGRVQAHWPDGTVQVRFDRAARSRLVWPAFLERVPR